MDPTQKLIIDAVSDWNPSLGKALSLELSKTSKGGDDRFRQDLRQMLALALSSLDRNPAATRANLENALQLLR